MARLFQASFERLTPAQLHSLGLWALVGSGIVSTTGRNGNGVTGTSGATQAQNTLRTVAFSTASADKGYQGFALKAVSLPAAERKVWALFDNAGAELVTVTVRPDGRVSSYAGSFETGSLLGTSSAAFVAAGSFRYLQVGYDFTADTLLVLSTNSGVTSLLASVPGLTSPLPWSFVEFYLDELLVLDDVYVNDSNTFIGPANNYFSGDTAVLDLGPVADVATGFGLERFYPNTGARQGGRYGRRGLRQRRDVRLFAGRLQLPALSDGDADRRRANGGRRPGDHGWPGRLIDVGA
jgi:hypothetical protein